MREICCSRLSGSVSVSTLLVALLAALGLTSAAAAFPKTINYQGVLTNLAGQPVSGSFSVVFAFYTAASGGSPVWSETQTVQVDQGIYDVQIGITEYSGFPIPFNIQYFLGITVDSGPEMTPRQPLTAVPYAFESLRSGWAGMADAVVPGAVTSASIQDASITDADIGGVISATKLGSHSHSGADISSGTVVEARIDASIARDNEIIPKVLAADGAASGLDADLLDGADSSAFASAAAVAAMQGQVATLQSQVAALQDLLQHLSRSGNDLTITGANLHIVDGTGDTWGIPNGLGNLIVGYNEPRDDPSDDRSGSHNLVIGQRNSYSSYAGFLAGYENSASGAYASILAGSYNMATGQSSSISGGTFNLASGSTSSVSGGYGNQASGDFSAVAGGGVNLASHNRSTVAGGMGGSTIAYGMLATKHTHYTATSTSAADVAALTTEHSICALTHVSLQTGAANTYKYCTLAENGDDTWTLTAHGGASTTIRCDAECF